jgi:ribosomal protein S18 acetylase RimI-like enzyme
MTALKRPASAGSPEGERASPAIIALERADSPDARALISELESELDPLYPEQSRHGYSVEKLLREGVAFFVTRHGGVAAGCGGIQLCDGYGEIKRMYVRPRFRGLGLGKLMLDHLADHARQNARTLLRLETGVYQHAALVLYERFGFRRIAAFGPYRPDPLSAFYELHLD